MGRALVVLHGISGILIAAATVMGYVSARDEASLGAHVWAGFLFALVIGFTHAMTLFWFAGMGVGMREAAAGKPGTGPCLERAAVLRRRVAVPLGVALVTLMAAVILGGGSHTRVLSGTPHHVASIAALLSGLFLNVLAARTIAAYESIVRELESIIEG
jgi:hypothetical protein